LFFWNHFRRKLQAIESQQELDGDAACDNVECESIGHPDLPGIGFNSCGK
jgi:hypothetical protein